MEENDASEVKLAVKLLTSAYHLLWVWKQYNSMYGSGDANNEFSHACMSAGEEAADYLESLGLGHDQGWKFIANDTAMALMDCEIGDNGIVSLPQELMNCDSVEDLIRSAQVCCAHETEETERQVRETEASIKRGARQSSTRFKLR